MKEIGFNFTDEEGDVYTGTFHIEKIDSGDGTFFNDCGFYDLKKNGNKKEVEELAKDVADNLYNYCKQQVYAQD